MNKNHPPRENIAIVPDDTVLDGIDYQKREDGTGPRTQVTAPTWGEARADIVFELKDMADALNYAAHLVEDDQHIGGATIIGQGTAMHLIEFVIPMLETMHRFEHMNNEINKAVDGFTMPDTFDELLKMLGRAPSQRH